MATAKSKSEANVNTTESVKKGKAITQADIDAAVKKAGAELNKEKKVKVKIPAYLSKRLGPMQPIGINGAVVYIPVGEEVEIPQSYKSILDEMIDNLDI